MAKVIARVKYLSVKDGMLMSIDRFPSFHKSGSIKSMREKFYGKDALLVRCGDYIYNVSSEPQIYWRAH